LNLLDIRKSTVKDQPRVGPTPRAQKVFLEKNAGNKAAVEFIANQRHETQLYYKYKEYYGYVFYIGKKY